MLLTLAARNVLRNFRRLVPMVLILVIVFGLLMMGNAVLRTTLDSLYGVYAGSVTGDLTVSSVGEDNFTVFGSDQLLVGQYLVPPTIVGFSELRVDVEALPEVRGAAGLLSSAARVKIEKQRKDCTVFGVDFGSYPGVVPGLKLVAGSFPEPDQAGIVIQTRGWKNPSSLIGKKALLTAGLGRNFIIREVTLTGIVSYPVQDELLDTVVLVDADTARALNGYLQGGGSEISEEETGILESGFEDLFGESAGTDKEDGQAAIDPLEIFSEETKEPSLSVAADPLTEEMSGPLDEAVDADGTDEAEEAWNFLLLSLHDASAGPSVARRLESLGYTEDEGYLVRDWSRSVGGTALLARFLQILFNIGLVFVSFGAVIVAANAMLLSILERTGEIGTMRAMGAGRTRVSMLIILETLFVVFGSAVVGILAGIWGIHRLNAAGPVVDNPYIRVLFGGEPIRGTIDPTMLFGHLAVALVLAGISVLYPLKRAMAISPVEAMKE